MFDVDYRRVMPLHTTYWSWMRMRKRVKKSIVRFLPSPSFPTRSIKYLRVRQGSSLHTVFFLGDGEREREQLTRKWQGGRVHDSASVPGPPTDIIKTCFLFLLKINKGLIDWNWRKKTNNKQQAERSFLAYEITTLQKVLPSLLDLYSFQTLI